MRNRGFSLLELLLVLLIVSMMAALVGTSVSRSVSAAELRNASRGLIAALRYTRSHAMVTHEEQVLLIDTEKKSYTPPLRDAVELPQAIELSLTTARRELVNENLGGIRFFPDGASTGGKVILFVNKRQYEVNISWLTGEARMTRVES